MFRSGLLVSPFVFVTRLKSISSIFNVSPEIEKGLSKHLPIVALESTVLTHGLPWPVNYELGGQLECIIRENGAIPATIGVLDGKVKVGCEENDIKSLCQSSQLKHQGPVKISRSNYYRIPQIRHGGTTVSGTIIACNKVGIQIFATGGIGGVHRDVINSMDISADLKEIGRNQICVVSSGVKSILDIAKTLEYLETEGVFVCTLYSSEFPGFFQPKSGLKSPNSVQSIEESAKLINNMIELNIDSGMLLAIPIPQHYNEEGLEVESSIKKALKLAEENRIIGQKITPFLLQKTNELTNGKSLELNMRLLKNNAQIASEIAVERYKMSKNENKTIHVLKEININNKNTNKYKSVTVVGGSIIDENYKFNDKSITDLSCIVQRATYDGSISESSGGVGRNIAETLSRLGISCQFLTAIGNDVSGKMLIDSTKEILNWKFALKSHKISTMKSLVLHMHNKDILFHLLDTKCLNLITTQYLASKCTELTSDNTSVLISDCNVPLNSMKYLFNLSVSKNIPLLIEPTDILLIPKLCDLIRTEIVNDQLKIVTPNIHEFYEILKNLNIKIDFQLENCESSLNLIIDLFKQYKLLELFQIWIIKLGKNGVLFVSNFETYFIKQSENFVDSDRIVTASGAGDCLISCVVHLRFNLDLSWTESIMGAMKIAQESLYCPGAVPSSISPTDYDRENVLKWISKMKSDKMLNVFK